MLAALSALAMAYGECASCCDIQLLPHGSVGLSDAAASSWSQGEVETNKIDVLIAFDDSAVLWLKENGWNTSTEFAKVALADMNAGIANTGLDEYFTFRLAGVSTLESDLSKVELKRIPAQACGLTVPGSRAEKSAYKRLRSVRNSKKADIVAIVVDPVVTNVYGGGFQMSNEHLTRLAVYAENAYCVCAVSAVIPRHSLLHEVGHLMGAGHVDNIRPSSNPGPGVFAYSSGYSFKAGGRHYTSVMGYPKDGVNADITWERLPFFSSPDYTLQLCDEGTGEVYDSGVAVGTSDRNDNTRTLRETYAVVANFRVAKAQDVNPSPPKEPDPDDGAQPLSLSLAQSVDGDMVPIKSGQVLGVCQYVRQDIAVAVSSSARLKTKVKVKGLPSGLVYSSKTGHITGYAKKSGAFSVTVTASDTAKHSVTCRFSLKVAACPDWSIGTFDGACIWEDKVVPVTVKVASTGRITGKFVVDGRSRSASSSGFSSFRDGEMLANLTVKLASDQSRDIGFRILERPFADRLGRNASIGQVVLAGNDSGFLLQDVWSSKKIASCTIKKARQITLSPQTCPDAGLSAEDTIVLKVKSKGKVSVSGKISGVKVSATAKLCRVGWNGSREKACVNIVLPEKKSFRGFAKRVWLLLTTDAKGAVIDIETGVCEAAIYSFDL